MPLDKVIELLFYAGIIPIIIKSVFVYKYIASATTYEKEISCIEDGIKSYTSTFIPNVPLGILAVVISFVLLIILWKLICELLYVIFNFLETNSR